MKKTVSRAALVSFALLLSMAGLAADSKVLHLSVGDPARKGRDVPLVLDGITDTATGELITPSDLPGRLSKTRLLLIGEEHTSVDSHRVQLQVLQALAKAGRRVLIGLEMYPYTEQASLDQWNGGNMSADDFVRLSRWYENWGYNWLYYSDIFLFARDNRLPMFAVNTPREVVAAVRKKGLKNLTPEEAAHIPAEIDADDADHMVFFKTTFEGEEGPVHGANMPEEMWKNMLSAQATWDATMGYNAVQALKREADPNAIMVVLVGSGHVAYDLGITRQARRWFDGGIASIIPLAVEDDDGPVENVRASYANFVWGVPGAIDSEYPSLGISTAVGKGEVSRRVLIVQKDSPAERAGLKAGDVILTVDGTPLADKETFNKLLAAKRWGDQVRVGIKRGEEEQTVTAVLRRKSRAKS